MVKFISDNLKYPTVCKELKIQGKVMVKFTVKSDGSIGNVRITKSVDTNLDKEAVRLVKSMPRWTPNTQYQYDAVCGQYSLVSFHTAII